MHFQSMHPYAQARQKALRVVWKQCVLVLICAFVALFFGARHSLYVLCGGGACLIPNALFLFYFCGIDRSRAYQRMVGRFYVGALSKFVLSAGVLAILVAWKTSEVSSFLFGFVGGQVGAWFAPFVM